jgi:protoporphyrinogen oxidase
MKNKKEIIVIGAGPAGLTLAYEILKESTDYNVTILEGEGDVGGLSRTINHNGNLLDIGGHRFFTKDKRVQKMFEEVFPVLENKHSDDIFLKRKRLSRIFFRNNFFHYPLRLSMGTVFKFGLLETFLVVFSYLYSKVFIKNESDNLEEFFISRFGKRLYLKFFKDYTEKVWGVKCSQINSEWGNQRVKGLSLIEMMWSLLFNRTKDKHTSLIDEFLYPKFGPGQFWNKVKSDIASKGAVIRLNEKVTEVYKEDNGWRVSTKDGSYSGDLCISTMPLRSLFKSIKTGVPENIMSISNQLEYRDFLTVGLELSDFHMSNDPSVVRGHPFLPDNWLYVQDEGIKVGRVQIFNNWSPYMVKDIKSPWIGLEYFCQKGDVFWNMTNEAIVKKSFEELITMGLVDPETKILNQTVVRAPKAYPKYTGSYKDIDILKDYVIGQYNFYSVGRNGMHRYNNQDHSMLSAMKAADHILGKDVDKESYWQVNTNNEYIESSTK